MYMRRRCKFTRHKDNSNKQLVEVIKKTHR